MARVQRRHQPADRAALARGVPALEQRQHRRAERVVVARAGDGQATAQQAQRQQPLLGGFEPLGLLPARQLERQVEIVEPTHDSSLSSEPLPPHRPVDPSPSFPRLEEAVLERWRERDVFRESLRRREGADRLRLLRGPADRQRPPGAHHVLARVFKDIFPRYKTMRGHYVERKGGWDCHGLPVEIAVEKELGSTRKADIERYGIERVQRSSAASRCSRSRGLEPR